MKVAVKANIIKYACSATGRSRCQKEKSLLRFYNMPRIDLSASEIVFLFYFAFQYDIEAKLIAKLTKISEATVSEWRNYYNERLGVYLDEYF